ncbi:MFS transporter [Sphingomonas bacterium]|uniref:MFS transporter n=1 Tax=Sphingomonas bacterium TaxID=1895847 RepID=UPI001575D5AE|nr:MFS transporter [Sphingomonas bacterium]
MTDTTRSHERSTVAAASVGMALCIIPVFLGTFPMFLNIFSLQQKHVAYVFPALLLLSTCTSAVTNVFTGWLVDRHGPKRIAVPGVLFFGLAVAALSLTDRAGSALFPLYGLLGVAAAFTGPVVFAKALSGLVQIQRGVAFGIAITAAPMLSAAILAPVAQSLINAFGWRDAYLALGGIVVAVGVPVVWRFLWEAPRGAAPAHGRSPPPAVPLRRALLDPQFLLVTGAIAVSAIVATGVSSFLLPIAQDDGVGQTIAVWTVSLFSLGALAGALVFSAFIDRAGSPRALLGCFAVTIAGALLLRGATSSKMFLVGGALLGAGHYGAQSLLPFIMTRYFGVVRLGQIFGTCAAVVSISSALGPLMVGIAHANNVPFSRILAAAIVLLVVGGLMIPWLRAFPDRAVTVGASGSEASMPVGQLVP